MGDQITSGVLGVRLLALPFAGWLDPGTVVPPALAGFSFGAGGSTLGKKKRMKIGSINQSGHAKLTKLDILGPKT